MLWNTSVRGIECNQIKSKVQSISLFFMLIIFTVSLPCAGPQIRWWPDTDNVINNRNAITRSLGVYSTVQYSNAITRPGVSRVSRLFTHAGDLSIINQVSCCCLCIVEWKKKEGARLVLKQNTKWFHRKLCNRVASCVSISIPPQLVCSGIRSAMGKKYVQCRKLTFYMIFTHPPGPPAVSISLLQSFF